MSDKYIKTLRRMALDGSLDAQTAETLLRMRDAQWEASKHPRGKGGKFAPKGSGSVSGGGESESSGESSGGSSGTMKEEKGLFRQKGRVYQFTIEGGRNDTPELFPDEEIIPEEEKLILDFGDSWFLEQYIAGKHTAC